MSTFKELGINKELRQALSEIGIKSPTEIQEKSIPALLNGALDFVAQAPTGTGKTATFALPIIENIDPNNKHVQALILTPTRELGLQIAKQIFKFTKYLPNKVFCEAVYGGAHILNQINALKRPTQIIVATPGRLIDLYNKNAVDFSHLQTVVLDEADEMLNMGFKAEIDQIMELIKTDPHVWLFSATLPAEINELIQRHIGKGATRVHVDKKNLVNKNIEHRYIECQIDDKLNIIVSFLKNRSGDRGVVFCRTKKGAQKLANQLKAKNINADAIHGDLLQKDRDKVMRAFVNESIDVLVATDVAARGIDVKDLGFVIHHQLPEQEENYTHRSGRTARAGKQGLSLALVTPSEVNYVHSLGKKLGIMIKAL